MTKIFFYINSMANGGAERVLATLAEQFALHGYEATLITSFHDDWEYEVSSEVYRVTLEEQKKETGVLQRNVGRIRKLRKICKNGKPDIFISFMSEPNVRMLLATAGLKIRRIISIRNNPRVSGKWSLRSMLEELLYPYADGCVFQTDAARKCFPEKLQRKSVVIPNMIREEFYQIERKPVCHRIITCGRLNHVKDHKMLLEAFSEIAQEIPDAELYLYGDGELRVPLLRLTEEKKLNDRIHFAGQQAELTEALSKADIFVLSSRSEGMPNALMEAMAAGIPCISTDCPCGAPRELLKDGENGLLVPVGDRRTMAAALKKLLLDENREEIGRRGKESVNIYRTEVIFHKWENYALAEESVS